MITEIKIFNRFIMDRFVLMEGFNFPYDRCYIISIYSKDVGEYLTDVARAILARVGMVKGLSLNFDDITEDESNHIKKERPEMDLSLFKEKHSIRIIDFLNEAQNDPIEAVLMVHCNAGVSRSGAVGTFACDYYGMDYGEFLKANPYIMANSYVLRILRRMSGMTPMTNHDGVDHIDYGNNIIITGK